MSVFEIIINFTLVIVCFVMGAFFLVFTGYKFINNSQYKTSLKILSFSYFLMGVINSINLFFDIADYQTEFLPFLIILTASLQAILFTYSLILLINPNMINRKVLRNNLIPIFILSFVYLITKFFSDSVVITSITVLKENILNPTVILRVLFFLFYIFQLVYFSILFIKNSNSYKKAIDNYFSETEKVELFWVRIAFFSALSIGIVILTYQIFPSRTYNLIVAFVCLIYYFLFAVYYLNYNRLYQKIEPIFSTYETDSLQNIDSLQSKSKWGSLKSTVIEKKLYLKEGITLEELSRSLFVARTTLSNLINSEEGVNYNTWINRLRIEEAKNFFLQNPDYTISEISQLTGFSEQSNFSRQFKIITGQTPSNWKKENLS